MRSSGWVASQLGPVSMMSPVENVPDKPKRTVLETVLDDFISNLEKDAAVEKALVSRLQKLVKGNEFGIERLKAALFSEDAL